MSAQGDKRGGPVRRRIAIVDDHPIVREGLLRSINRELDLIVCSEAANAEQALEEMDKATPDLVLLDVSMPGKGGLALIKDLRARYPDLPVLVLSRHDESLFAEPVLRAGARGYIMKDERPEKVIEAIRHVLGGHVYVSARMAARLLEVFSGRGPSRGRLPLDRLTDREFQVLHLIAQGKNSREIAKHLRLSVKTVDTHRAHLKEKLRLKSALRLTQYAVRWLETQEPLKPTRETAASQPGHADSRPQPGQPRV